MALSCSGSGSEIHNGWLTLLHLILKKKQKKKGVTWIPPLHNLEMIVNHWNHSTTVNMQWHIGSNLKMPHKSVWHFFFFECYFQKARHFRWTSHVYSFIYFDWKRELNLNGKMTGSGCDPALRKPSHHFVRPYRSQGKSEKDWDGEREGGKERERELKGNVGDDGCRDENTEGNNVPFQKWLVWFLSR